MHKKFEINRTKVKGSCQSGRKVVTHYSKRTLPLDMYLKSDSAFTQSYIHILCGGQCVKSYLVYMVARVM